MRLQTVSWRWTRAMTDAFLASILARPAGPAVLTPALRLITATLTGGISDAMVVADYTEAVFDGYGAIVLPTLLGPLEVPSGWRALLGDADWLSDAATPDTPAVIGVLLVNGGDAGPATVVYGGEIFDEPVDMSPAGKPLAYDLYLAAPRFATTGLEP